MDGEHMILDCIP